MMTNKDRYNISVILVLYFLICFILLSLLISCDKEEQIEENKSYIETLERDSINKPSKSIDRIIIEEIITKEVSIDKETHDYNVYHVAKVVWAEARGCTKLEQSAVVWCILNRVDAGYGTIYEVITAPNQFAYVDVEPFQDIYDLVDDVLNRWYREKSGEIDVGRTLPKEYKYFWGDNLHNYFRIKITDQVYWDWSLPNPYEE